jgi:hypothetical protein
MAYKVLGQTLTPAASADIVVNLIKDPSFEGITRSMTGAANYTSAVWESVTGTRWNYQNENNSYYAQDKFGDISQPFYSTETPGINLATASSRYGSKVVAWGSSSSPGQYSGDNYLSYGLSTSVSGSQRNSNFFGGVTNSIPVTGSTLYYFGCDAMGGSYTSSEFSVLWFTSAGTYISQSQFNPLSSVSSSSWTRNNSTATSPSNAAYAGILIQMNYYRNGRIQVAMDGVYFGPSASAGSAGVFPDPSTGGTNSSLTAPFTGRFTSTWSGTPNDSVTVQNFAGAATDLYTVPASKEAVISTIAVSNPTTSATTYRIAVVPSGETLALKNWIAFDIPLSANTTTTLTLGLTLAAGDKIQVSNDTANISFTAFGSEN